MNIDDKVDELFDDLNFKPITKGLGFHHSIKEEIEIKSTINKSSNELKKDFAKRQTQLNLNKKKTVNMGELSAFYEKTEVIKPVELGNTNIVELEGAKLAIRFSAWVVDTILISTMLVSMLISVIFTAKLPWDTLSNIMMTDGLLESFVVLFLMLYGFYFSFFDKTEFSSPGKHLFKIKVINVKGESVTFGQSFSRALLSVLSLPLLGLINLLELQDSFTNTKIVKNERIK